MLVKWLAVLFLLVEACKAANVTDAPTRDWNFNQTDYDVKMERLTVMRCNHSYFRYLKAEFAPYNRTQRVINASCELLVDILEDGVKLDIQVYKFRSNEYRFFPITYTTNPCLEYSRDSFHVTDFTTKMSNFRGCPVRKGFYSITNGLPDISKFPPLIPHGQYKMNTNWYYKTDFLMEVDIYASAVAKPMKWH